MHEASTSNAAPPTTAIATGWGTIFVLALLTNPGAVIGALAPTFVDAFVARGMAVDNAARLGAAELFSIAVTLLFAPLVVNRWDRRILAFCAVIIGTAGQFGSVLVDDPITIGAFRMLAGAGEGAVYALAVAAISSTDTPDRTFSVSVASNLITTTILLAMIVWFAKGSPASAAMIVTGIFVADIQFWFLGYRARQLGKALHPPRRRHQVAGAFP